MNIKANPVLQFTPIDYMKGTPLRNKDGEDVDASLVATLFGKYVYM
jgi:hypothetical protein